jgi:RecA-family ATPase
MREFLRQYTGDKLLNPEVELSKPLIQDFLFENDYVLLVAAPKIGKSILAQQIACAVSSGESFLDTFDVPNPQKVWYFATEGKDADMQDRFLRMSKGVECNPDNLHLFCSAGLRFNTTKGANAVMELIKATPKDELPKLIVIDALYRSVKGSLTSDDVINEFHNIVGQIKDHCGAAVLIVHHLKKATRNIADGTYFKQGDDDAYGSAFIQASVDHTFLLSKCRKDNRDIIFRCDTQRSGNIIESLRLRMTEPNPLLFKIVAKHDEELKRVLLMLGNNKEGLTLVNLMKKTKIKRSTMYCVIKELMDDGKLKKSEGKEKVYSLSNGELF